MPMPVSRMTTTAVLPLSDTSISMLPLGLLYFIAFSTMLVKTSISPSRSPFTVTLAPVRLVVTPLDCAEGSMSLTTSFIITIRSVITGLNCMVLVSSLDITSILFMMSHILLTVSPILRIASL